MLPLRSLLYPLFGFGIFLAALLTVCLWPTTSANAAGEPSTTLPGLRLPSTDFQYKQTKSYIEDQPVPEYQHASPAAFDAFEDIKYGIRIHWGIYSIWARANESWPFLTMSPTSGL